MRNLNVVAKECMEMLDVIDIKYGIIDEFVVNTRAKSRWGQCVHKGGNHFSININADLLDERNSIDGLKSTIVHELLHTVKGCHGHDSAWKRLANLVNDCHPFLLIQRCSSSEEKGIVHRSEKVVAPYKYEVSCPTCGIIWKYKKMSKCVSYSSLYSCGKCHTTLVRTK